jgi:hypothetical protein
MFILYLTSPLKVNLMGEGRRITMGAVSGHPVTFDTASQTRYSESESRPATYV